MASPMLELKNIVKVFNADTEDEKRAMDSINLTIEKGEFVTVIGSNGAGKSTLLNIIAGTLQPDEGSVTINNKDVTRIPDYKRASLLARVFQNTTMGTAGEMSIEENLCMAELRGKKRGLKWGVTKNRRSRYREILKTLELGLEDRLTQSVGLLSGGQRQSLTLLMATLIMPEMLLLDEHTAALDPKTAAKVIELTNTVVQENQLTTLMITHNMQQAIHYGNRMIMLHQGKIQLDIKGEEKAKLTVNDVVAKFSHTLKDEALLSN